MRQEAKARDPATGQQRLRNQELLPAIIDIIMASAVFPSDEEFTACWSSALRRMENSASPTDWNEPLLAAYLRDHIIDTTGPLHRALWSTGLGAVPLGFTAYAPNAIERTWRLLKGLFAAGWKSRSPAEVIVETCQALRSRVDKGCYATLSQRVANAWPALHAASKSTQGPREPVYADSEDEEGGETKVRHARLDLEKMLKHYRQHGARGTFLVSNCHKRLADGFEARVLYAIPKYNLDFVASKPDDIAAALKLGLASSVPEVADACACPETGAYDIFRHIYLRQSFTTVFVAADGQVVDEHRNFVEGGGHTEHALFIANLKGHKEQPPATGPKSSQPHKAQPKGKPKRSERLKAMLKPPSSMERRTGGVKAEVAPQLPVVDKPGPDSDLPGAPPPAQLPILHCSLHGDQCLARTGRGTRCKKARVHGEFLHSALRPGQPRGPSGGLVQVHARCRRRRAGRLGEVHDRVCKAGESGGEPTGPGANQKGIGRVGAQAALPWLYPRGDPMPTGIASLRQSSKRLACRCSHLPSGRQL